MTKSAIARGASMAADVWGRLDEKVKTKGGTEDALHILAKKEGDSLLDAIADLLVTAELKTRKSFTVTVDFSKSLADMVAAGKYNYVNEYITAENFPIEGTGIVETEVVLINFDRNISSEDAIREMEQMGLEPCKIEHLLALGAKHPDLQKEYPIIALGSSWLFSDGHRSVPCLLSWIARRELSLYWYAYEWYRDCRFAAVRKS